MTPHIPYPLDYHQTPTLAARRDLGGVQQDIQNPRPLALLSAFAANGGALRPPFAASGRVVSFRIG